MLCATTQADRNGQIITNSRRHRNRQLNAVLKPVLPGDTGARRRFSPMAERPFIVAKSFFGTRRSRFLVSHHQAKYAPLPPLGRHIAHV